MGNATMDSVTQRQAPAPIIVDPQPALDGATSWAVHALLELTDTVGVDASPVPAVVDRFVELVGPAEVGVLLCDEHDGLELSHSSAERLRVLQTFEVEHAQGPGVDALAGADPPVNLRAGQWDSRWSRVGPLARALGYDILHVFPLRLRDVTFGVVEVYDIEPRDLAPDALELGRALAVGAAIGIAHERAVRHHALLSQQLQLALQSRVLIEQAKGVTAARLGVGMDEAFGLLRRFARNHNRSIGTVAQAVIDGQLGSDGLRTGRLPAPAGSRPPNAHRP